MYIATLGQPLKKWKFKKGIIDILRKKKKLSHINDQLKSQKEEKMEDKTRNKEYRQQIENSNKYSRY